MDWFVGAVGVPASIGSGTGKEEETCRPPESEVPPGVVWEEPKTEERRLAAKRRATRGGSVCLSRSSLWVAGRPNITTPTFVPFGRSAAFFL